MKYLFFVLFSILLFSSACQSDPKKVHQQHFQLLDSVIRKVEADLIPMEADIAALANYSSFLFQKADSLVPLGDDSKFLSDERGFIYNKNESGDESTVFVSIVAKNKPLAIREIHITEPLDSAFIKILEKRKMVCQIYFNSASHFNRLYPPYDLLNSLDPEIDITAFNFYYMADEARNPNRKAVWVQEVYIDPVGRGWILSLIHPVYHDNELKGVLGFDITLFDLMKAFLEKSDKKLMLIDSQGTIVAGKAEAIEALSMPPLKNHAYIQTIQSDNFRKENFNLYKSKSKEVRQMASKFLLEKENYHSFEMGGRLFEAYCKRMNLMDWYLLDIHD
ncbi:PDC sensor domain-containing protein [Cyclobacterium jeungdonense]|uniref:Cache domain-containing protein n=1 Tax=Cyclobacterium jeungdonense TaxID=708087 RepID=A0ABT8C9E0_9BACT|nr:cache domain-containing protein [Cyclobacterium jeungdonense]MDN3688380.1 cache domain-containing protein [Cyclobacterium jeungdonense]